MKKCSRCKQERELSEFNHDPRYKDRHGSRCRSCNADYQREKRGKSVDTARKGKPMRLGQWAKVVCRVSDVREDRCDVEPGGRRGIGAGQPEVNFAIAVIDRAFSDLALPVRKGNSNKQVNMPTAEERETAIAFFEHSDGFLSLHDCIERVRVFGEVALDIEAVRAEARKYYGTVEPQRVPRARIVPVRAA